MTITITNTTKIVAVNGVPAGIWEGKTAAGIPIICFVTCVAVPNDQDQRQFEQELLEQFAPSAAADDYSDLAAKLGYDPLQAQILRMVRDWRIQG